MAKKVESHTVGRVRYFTYYLIFPKDSDVWVDQQPFVGDLKGILPLTRFNKKPQAMRELLKQGQTTWKDQNGVTHRVVIEDFERPRKWGLRK